MTMKGGGGNALHGGRFRFRRDDGSHDPFGGSWMEQLNGNSEMTLDEPQFRLRFGIKRDFASAVSFNFILAYSLNAGAFAQVLDDGTTPVTNVSSPEITNNDDTVPYSGSNQVYEDTWADTTNAATITDDAESNTGISDWADDIAYGLSMEICLQLEPSLLSVGDTIDLRPYQDGLVVFTVGYDQTARITITTAYDQYIPVGYRARTLGRILTR